MTKGIDAHVTAAAPLEHLLPRLDDDPHFTDLASGRDMLVPAPVRAFLLAGLARSRDTAVLAVTPTEADANTIAAAAGEFCPHVALLPAWDVLPYEGLEPQAAIASNRIRAIHVLARESGPRVVVASVRGLIQKPAPGAAGLEPLRLRAGVDVDRDDLVAGLAALGYAREDVAQEPGTFAVRGGIVDVFGATSARLVRLELDGDHIASIRWADPETQRSMQDAGPVELYARSELPPTPEIRARAALALESLRGARWAEEIVDRLARLASGARPDGAESLLPRLWDPDTDSLAAFVPGGSLIAVIDPDRCMDEAERAVTEEEELAALWSDPDAITSIRAPQSGRARRDDSTLIYRPAGEVLSELSRDSTLVRLTSFRREESEAELDASGWGPGLSPHVLLERCRELQAQGWDVVVCAHDPEAPGVGARLVEEGLSGARVVVSGLRGGFLQPALKLALVTHTEWHARPPAPHRPTRRSRPRALSELRPGDLVVHVLHGIGRYVGMETREVAGFRREYLVCEYAAGDRLFVPSDAAESLQRYIGSEQPALSRLGTADWERVKARVRKRVRDIAADLIRLYSARLHAPGHPFPEDTPWQRELEESFPFDETPDQLLAIQDIARDMARPMPMDRLVCGDVGYGKTEVAVRAAFKAVTEGKQVAVLVPTTLLAQQHHLTFTERLGPFGVNVAMLSRFLSPPEQDAVVASVAAGRVDVVIGTHRLLGKDLAFRDLGLVVVDEEHRFGVSQKERLKRMRVEVDVLTLTATPIPRTLEMSMSGIRDLSVIETPPAARRPIRTFVGPFEERIVTAAIRRELARGGQVFHVHNRVQTIERERLRLERAVPEARIAVGHGQMDEDKLEATMLSFWNREIDVLLCTTIIEAGLDIPTVNTLIVDHADKLGLAQLYQLRGRVGRAGEQAYAYLFYPPNVRLSETAHERLKTLAQFTELGSGMAIALKDLEIRGAGNLLGAEQHGHIEAVGFEMYVRLLEEATRELKGEAPAPEAAELRIDVPINAYLPATYIDREPLRLAAYRRIAEASTAADVGEVRDELRDRFGPLPPPALALLAVAELRAALRPLGISDLSVAPHELHGRVAKMKPVELGADSMRVRLRWLHPRAVFSDATRTLILPIPDVEGRELLEWLRKSLLELLGRDIVPA